MADGADHLAIAVRGGMFQHCLIRRSDGAHAMGADVSGLDVAAAPNTGAGLASEEEALAAEGTATHQASEAPSRQERYP